MSYYLPDRRPPPKHRSLLNVLRQSLFSNIFNSLITIVLLLLLSLILPTILRWTIIDANWRGDSAAACTGDGACWVFIKVRLAQFMYGFYPPEQRWRVNLLFAIIVPFLTLLWLVSKGRWRYLLTLLILFALPLFSWFLLRGGIAGLLFVPTNLWGGMMLTLVISSAGILFSLPLGIVLALWRTSKLPVLRLLATIFIEAWRGVPLITVLFMASVMLPLFLPPQVFVDNLIRALIGVGLFASAYMAEVIRGGLQGVARGQYEAAQSLGLSYWHSVHKIILPQALQNVIPAITNTYIGLFKDTTLVSIIGLFDFLGIVHSAAKDPKWLGYHLEGYIFCAIVYFIICYAISRSGLQIERHLKKRYE